MTWPLDPLGFVVVAFGAYRAARLLTKDTILEGVRDRIGAWSYRHDVAGHRVRGKVEELVTCPYCMGWWLSAVAYVVACVAQHRWGGFGLWVHAVQCWGIMGAQALLNAVDAWMEQTNAMATEVKEQVDGE